MNRIVSAMMMMALTASLAEAQSGASGSSSGQATVSVAAKGAKDASAATEAQASLVENAAVDPAALRQQIESKAAKTSAKARARAEARLEATSKAVDAEADQGESKVAGRLATEFDMTSDDLMAEKSSTGASWGGLMIAHTLAANTKTSVTAPELISMHEGGMGWGQIAAGLGLNLGEAVSAVQSEGKVAGGTLKADGKIAVAHGEGAKAGLGLGVKTNAATQAGGAKVGATAGVGAGIKIKP
jgi:hypothetical protein